MGPPFPRCTRRSSCCPRCCWWKCPLGKACSRRRLSRLAQTSIWGERRVSGKASARGSLVTEAPITTRSKRGNEGGPPNSPRSRWLANRLISLAIISHLPATQSTQFSPGTVLILPASQSSQPWRSSLDVLPGPHAKHWSGEVEPVDCWNFPTAQVVQELAPMDSVYFPKPHEMQAAEEVALVVGEAVPAGQLVHFESRAAR